MNGVASRLRTRVGSVVLPAGLTAVLCFAIAAACSFSVRGVLGARVQPCDGGSRQAFLVLAVPELSRSPLNPRFKPEGCVLVSGYWMQEQRGDVEMRVVADGTASLVVDGKLVAERGTQSPGRMAAGRAWLDAGAHRFEMRFEPEGQAQLRGVVVEEGRARNLDPTFLRPPMAWESLAERASRFFARLAAVFLALTLVGLLLSPGPFRPAVAIIVFASLLRFEALIGLYGEGLPGVLVRNLMLVGHSLRPDTWGWEKAWTPYAGGDPMNYIEFARHMRGFFDAHVREPLFVAWSRLFIVDLGLGDLGISVASMIASCVMVAGTFVFARARFGQGVAVIAAVLLAADPAEIGLSVEGWRDGAFAASFVFALWAAERARLDPSSAKAGLAGVIFGASCLLRLSALSYVVPAIIDIALLGRAPWGRRFGAAGRALGVTMLLVGPYLLSCTLAYGDPLYAVNYHLRYYRSGNAASGVSAASVYVFSFHDPWGRADTLFEGLTSYPFLSKWKPLELWFGSATTAITGASLLGLMGWLSSPTGRRVLLLTAFALVPFSFTWTLPGGAEYRFTLLAYPVYLVAAGWFVARVSALLRGLIAMKSVWGRAGKAVGASVVGLSVGMALRHARTVADGRAAREFTISGGPRDSLSASGFGMPHRDDEGFARTSVDGRRVLSLSLQPQCAWLLTLRWNGSNAEEVVEDGRVLGDLPPGAGAEPLEKTLRLPASMKAARQFEITGHGSFEFVNARFAPDQCRKP